MVTDQDKPAWEKTEEKVCQKLGLGHVGGSGQPDCGDHLNPDRYVEVKDYKRPFNAHDLKQVMQRKAVQGKNLEIYSTGSCTKNAVDLAKKSNVLLFCKFTTEEQLHI